MNNAGNDATPYMTPLSVVLEKLRVRGIQSEFRWTPDGFTIGTGKYYQPENLSIVKVYRFEGQSDPADNAILYVIEAKDGLTGFSLDMYGMYTNHEHEAGYDQFLRRIPVAGRSEQLLPEDPEDPE